jgi:hypothetical protein
MGLLHLSSAESGKQKTVEVTDAGRNALINAAPYWERAQGHLVGELGTEQWDRIVTDLGTIVAATRSGP